MPKTGSYVKVDRGLKTNPMWLEKPFSKGQAWVDLLILAQGVDTVKKYKGKIQQMKAGNVYTSIVYLSNRWGWSRNKVYRFLEDLKNAGMIDFQGFKKDGTPKPPSDGTPNRAFCGTINGTVLTIENWAFYQYGDTNNGTNNGTSNGTPKTKKTEHTIECTYNRERKRNKGRFAPDSPSEQKTVERDETGHVKLKPRDEGTVDDIPEIYREYYKTYQEFYDYMER